MKCVFFSLQPRCLYWNDKIAGWVGLGSLLIPGVHDTFEASTSHVHRLREFL